MSYLSVSSTLTSSSGRAYENSTLCYSNRKPLSKRIQRWNHRLARLFVGTVWPSEGIKTSSAVPTSSVQQSCQRIEKRAADLLHIPKKICDSKECNIKKENDPPTSSVSSSHKYRAKKKRVRPKKIRGQYRCRKCKGEKLRGHQCPSISSSSISVPESISSESMSSVSISAKEALSHHHES
jgi:hypothetical protein